MMADIPAATNTPPDPDPPPDALNVVSTSNNPSQQSTSSPAQDAALHPQAGAGEKEQSTPSPNSSSSTPPWLRWSRGLNSLLDDPQGRDLFERYLEQEGCSAQLTFLWACEGLKLTASKDPPKIPQLVRKIYRHFIQNLNLLGLQDHTRSDLAQAIVDGRFSDVCIFIKAEEEVLAHMRQNLYPNFIKSELYLSVANGEDYSLSSTTHELSGSGETKVAEDGEETSIASFTENGRDASCSTASYLHQLSLASGAIDPLTGESINLSSQGGEERLSSPKVPSPPLSTSASVQQALLPNTLQTVHEDSELNMGPQGGAHGSKIKLTKGALLATQLTRAIVLPGVSKSRKAEAAAGHYIPAAQAPFPYHASYSSYNPVSRVDSEIQSMSSDAMTEDGGHGSHSSNRKHVHRGHPVRPHQSGSSGGAGLSTQHHPERRVHQIPGIPSGARTDNRDNLPAFPCHGKVIAKGPNREAEIDPKAFASLLTRKLEDVKRQKELEERLSKRISETDEHSQGAEAITPNVLAAAITRLQLQDEELPADILDKHMSRVFADVTPTTRSPKLRSPTIGRRRGGGPLAASGIPVQRIRRERDVVSTFSGDSGNVHDFPSEPSLIGMTKSRSIPYELKMQHEQGDMSSFGLGPSRGHPIPRGGLGQKVPFGAAKKTSSEFLDSGISVISGATPSTVPPPPQPPPGIPYDLSESRVRQWMEQCGDDRVRMGRPTSSPPSQRRVKRGGISSSQMSAPLPPTSTLEEVRRRLTKKPPPLSPVGLQPASPQVMCGLSPGATGYSVSTLPRHHSPPSSEDSISTKECISSILIYDDSEVPFVLKIPKMKGGSSSGVTLAFFKEHLPKRGHYRYFFKTECPELDAKVVQEEVIDEMQELPLYEGRIFAHLRTTGGSSAMSS